MSDIFISYAQEDREKARVMAHALTAQGWDVWWDRSIPAGKMFDEVIEEAIDAANCIIVLWSKRSVASQWVKTEAGEGMQRKILVPILIEKDVKIPLPFRRVQAADLTRWQGADTNPTFQDLVRDIGAVAGEPEWVQAEDADFQDEVDFQDDDDIFGMDQSDWEEDRLLDERFDAAREAWIADDHKTAAIELKELAAQGHADSMNLLGLMYTRGDYFDNSDRKAVSWWRKAAELRHVDAMSWLGTYLKLGLGVRKNLREAFTWLERAALEGEPMAQFQFGIMYDIGEGVPEDPAEAVKWYKLSAAQGDSSGQYELASCYLHGRGIRKNRPKAREWCEKSAEQGDENAARLLADPTFW